MEFLLKTAYFIPGRKVQKIYACRGFPFVRKLAVRWRFGRNRFVFATDSFDAVIDIGANTCRAEIRKTKCDFGIKTETLVKQVATAHNKLYRWILFSQIAICVKEKRIRALVSGGSPFAHSKSSAEKKVPVIFIVEMIEHTQPKIIAGIVLGIPGMSVSNSEADFWSQANICGGINSRH